jgi:hypothetical protein
MNVNIANFVQENYDVKKNLDKLGEMENRVGKIEGEIV